MKLLRYGSRGQEKPALLDANGRLRDLSATLPDITGQMLSAERQSIASLGELRQTVEPWSP